MITTTEESPKNICPTSESRYSEYTQELEYENQKSETVFDFKAKIKRCGDTWYTRKTYVRKTIQSIEKGVS